MKTQEEKDLMIQRLSDERDSTPEYSFFNENNWIKLDAKIDIISGDMSLEDFDEGDWEEMDDVNMAFRAAEEAEDWLNGDLDDEDL